MSDFKIISFTCSCGIVYHGGIPNTCDICELERLFKLWISRIDPKERKETDHADNS